MSVAHTGVAPPARHEGLGRQWAVAGLAILGVATSSAWWSTVASARSMSAMTYGLAQVGRAMPFSSSVVAFIGMWTTMMAAMMLPSIAPRIVDQRTDARPARSAALGAVAFACSYLAIWALVGLVPLGGLVALRHVTHDLALLERAGGAAFVVAGVYEFSRWKNSSLDRCHTASSSRRPAAETPGVARAVRAGVSQGLACLGCCWALMAVLFVVGLMNLAWMAGIAVIFLAEKNWARGVRLARVVGLAVTGLGMAVLVHPSVLTAVASVHHRMVSV